MHVEQVKQHMFSAMSKADVKALKVLEAQGTEKREMAEIRFASVLLALSAANLAIDNLPGRAEQDVHGKVSFVRVNGMWRLPNDIAALQTFSLNLQVDDSPSSTAWRIGQMLDVPYSNGAYFWLQAMLASEWKTDSTLLDSTMAWKYEQLFNGVPLHSRYVGLSNPAVILRAIGAEVNGSNVRALTQGALNSGVDPTLSVPGMHSPMYAMPYSTNGLEALKVVLENGYSLEHKVGGTTVFLRAVTSLDSEMIKEILALGADAHVVDAHGRNAMHEAIWAANDEDHMENLLDVVEILSDAGVDPFLADEKGRTPVDELNSLIQSSCFKPSTEKRLMRALLLNSNKPESGNTPSP